MACVAVWWLGLISITSATILIQKFIFHAIYKSQLAVVDINYAQLVRIVKPTTVGRPNEKAHDGQRDIIHLKLFWCFSFSLSLI